MTSTGSRTLDSMVGRGRWLLAVLFVPLITGWCALALAYAPAGPSPGTIGLAALFVLLVAVIFWRVRRPRLRQACLLIAWGTVVGWFLLVPAPAEADWIAESKVAPQVEIFGDRVVVRGIRDFNYRSQTDFDARWVDRTYDLSRLRTADIFLSFWGPKLICHTFVSFGFERPDKTMDQLAVSIEVRKHEGQAYSAVGGMFRQFTLIYIWVTETDVIRLRTNFRGEQVYRYGLRIEPARLREIFLRYAEATQQLHDHPAWYNAVTSNCGIDILRTAWGDRVGFFPTFAQLFNGRWEREAYDQGRLDRSLPFEELRAQANISQAGRLATLANFSQAIRAHTVWLAVRNELLTRP